ncbi:Lipid-binding serum glycoprotein, C-terminal domain and Lipid-binding serum glycoprotein, N-terminal domain and Bactericidal permeability-increasing protein, alpha/beta domain-containing protein [Strongyloides ratti]|uniref:Lipid-binding serum glycoprotein, C-terminal domain and Lipid-binding serum glycoprotein, N-terminal domain and Bactericidal permeability-increasing protein, alpha/beta domain-containing protein n=1 Tax=Strongyloides ratti TaxID=34506 RepID=A0A090L202_STRRB|nr:Lipid-binding serum glycoprotein, C-terminal domain and Lipid-binding serum glycoprotein, N-terminal domain and Bactericidal permeability-increasing protein, alpha/beta domain-containing protein [Strongyloides ratti]CEF63841.1 Lipid-binding serum glycoprotein, C-terminal domain and Lipid-binding serum glycoprotein, N-terminal domain and Bactericidal permeability-increasing protein, alpha/beta domain-containing protein [Strongyloides ratti]
MIYSRLLCVVSTIFLAFYIKNVNGNVIPGAQIQFSKNGLNYLMGVAIDYINSEITKIHIPDIEGLFKFTYQLANIRIEQFNVPKSSNIIQLSPPDKVSINLQGIGGKMTAHYHVRIKEGFIHLSKSGTLDVSIVGASVDVTVAITSANGHPHISTSGCSANFRGFYIKFHGNLIDDIINLFRKEIERHFKRKVEEIICQEIEEVVIDMEILGSFKGFHVNYALTSNPESSTSSFAIPIEGLIYYDGHKDDPKIPKPNNVIHPYDSDKYLCIDFDGDRVLGSAAYAFKLSNLSDFLIDDNILKLFPEKIRNFFKCECSDGLCIGELIPEIKKNCPAGKSVAIDCSAIAFPGFHFNSSGIYVNATGNGNFQIVTPNGYNMKLFDLYMDIGLLIESDLKITNWVVSGDVELYEYHFQVKNSVVGTIQTQIIQQIIDDALKYLIVGLADGILKSGIPLPKIDHLNIVNSKFIFGRELLSVCTDFDLYL